MDKKKAAYLSFLLLVFLLLIPKDIYSSSNSAIIWFKVFLIILPLVALGWFFYFWFILFLLKNKAKKILDVDEKITFSKIIYFHLRGPDGKDYHNATLLGYGVNTPKGTGSTSALILTSNNRLLIVTNRSKNNFTQSTEIKAVLSLLKQDIKKVLMEDTDVETGVFTSKGVDLEIHTNTNQLYSLKIGGIAFNPLFNTLKIYTFKEQRDGIKKPLLKFFGEKI